MTHERLTAEWGRPGTVRGVGTVLGAGCGAVCGLAFGLYLQSGLVAAGGPVLGAALGAVGGRAAGAVGERAIRLTRGRGSDQPGADYDDRPPAG